MANNVIRRTRIEPDSKKHRKLSSAQRRRTHNFILLGLFPLLFLLFGLCNLLSPNRDFSESENRMLAQRPALTAASLKDGSFFSDFDTYYSDQFFGRDAWISLHLMTDRLLGRRESGDVYLGKNGYLFEKPASPDPDTVSANTEAIRAFAAAYPDAAMRLMLVPASANILTSELPGHAPVDDQIPVITEIYDTLGSAVTVCPVSDVLTEHAGEDIYYRTDHHWTSLGAYYAFTYCSDLLGIEEPVDSYNIYTVSKTFEGTLSSKSGSHDAQDTIEVYDPSASSVSYFVTYADSQTKSRSMYQRSCLDDKDQYTVFFGGNHPLITLQTTNDNGRRLVLFKDSYANCFVQFLYPYYEYIYVIDPRYYYDNVSSLMGSGVTDVLFLMSADTFLTGSALSDVLTSASS